MGSNLLVMFAVRHILVFGNACSAWLIVESVAGFIVLLRDCVAYFRTERELIWNMPWTFSKYVYLGNRYISPICLAIVWAALSEFAGLGVTNAVGSLPVM
jgi:hypothetical protein